MSRRKRHRQPTELPAAPLAPPTPPTTLQKLRLLAAIVLTGAWLALLIALASAT